MPPQEQKLCMAQDQTWELKIGYLLLRKWN